MKDVFALKKVSNALRLSIQLTRIVLMIAIPNLSDETFHNLLLDRAADVLALIQAIAVENIAEFVHEEICSVMEDGEYDPAVAARESESGLFLDLHSALIILRQQLVEEHLANKRLLPTASFCVAVDGSRQSYIAFEVATRLRRQGQVAIVNINEEQRTSYQLPLISSDFICQEYIGHCKRLQLPTKSVHIDCEESNPRFESVAMQIVYNCKHHEADFLVVGAVGKGGPAIEQVGHVPRELLHYTNVPVLIVPPAPVHAMPSRKYIFVVAVDQRSIQGQRCVNAALKLMCPVDMLRIVHFFKNPIVGAYDDMFLEYYREVIATAQIHGVVDCEPLAPDCTVTEGLQAYIAQHNASYLIVGLTDSVTSTETKPTANEIAADPIVQEDPLRRRENHIGRVTSALLFSPRCTLCLCP